jgi:hypothetical protein
MQELCCEFAKGKAPMGFYVLSFTKTRVNSKTNKLKNYGIMLVGGSGQIEALEHAGATPAYLTNIVYIGRDGKVWKADATYGESTSEFVGFASFTGSAGDTDKPILYNGLMTTTGLTAGSTYYLSDTKGAIATSAGTNSRKVGRAVGTTLLMIKNDND